MASENFNVSLLELRIKHARADVQDAIKGFQGIRRSMEEAQKAAARGLQSSGMDKFTASVDRANKEVQEGTRAWEQYRRAKEAAATPLPADFQVGDQAGRQIAGGLSEKLRAGVRTLPAINIPGLGISSEGLAKVSAAIASLPAATGPAIVGLGAAAVAIVALTDSAKKVEEASRRAIDANLEYSRLVATGTTESLSERRAALFQEVETARAAASEAFRIHLTLRDDTRAAFGAVGLALADFNSSIGTGAGELTSARKAAEDAGNTLTDLERQLGIMDAALASSEVAANDLAAAERALTEARQKNLDHQIQTEIRVLSHIPKTTEALEARLDAINREQEVLNDYVNTAGISAELTDQLRQQLADLGAEESLLSIKVRPLVAALDAAAAAAAIAADKEQMLADDRRRAAQEAAKLATEIENTQAKIDKLASESTAKIAGLTDDLNDKLGKARTDQDKAITDADKDARDARLEAQAEANEDAAKLEADHRKNLQRIARDHFRSRETAIQDRDAIALEAAQRTAEDALADELASRDEQREAIDKQLKKTNVQIDKRLREQTDNAIARYNEQTRIAHDAHRKAVDQERARAAAEIATNQQRIQQLEVQHRAYNAAALGTAKEGANSVLATHRIMWQQIVSTGQQALNAISGGLATGKPLPGAMGGQLPKVPIKSFDTGGLITRTGLAVVHRGEIIVPPNRGGGDVNVFVNGVGKTGRQIGEIAKQKIIEALNDVA